MSFTSYLKQCFVPPRVLVAPTEAEQKALRNIITIAKERMWLAENYPKRPEPSMDFEAELTGEQVQVCQQSLTLAEQFVNNFIHLEQPDGSEIAPVEKQ